MRGIVNRTINLQYNEQFEKKERSSTLRKRFIDPIHWRALRYLAKHNTSQSFSELRIVPCRTVLRRTAPQRMLTPKLKIFTLKTFIRPSLQHNLSNVQNENGEGEEHIRSPTPYCSPHEAHYEMHHCGIEHITLIM
jgi:hypothetical protein